MDSVFSTLSLVLVVGTLVSLAMRMFRQPLIIGYILTGILVGPVIFNFVKSPDSLAVFSDIGIALLLFIIGLGLNPRVIREVSRTAAIVGLAQVGIITALGWTAGLMLGLNSNEAAFLGASVAFSSTIIILKLLSDKREQNRLYGKIAIGVSLVQDLVAIALVIVTSAGSGKSLHVGSTLALTIKGVVLAYVIYWLSIRVLPHIQKLVAGSQEFLFLFAIAAGLGSAALFAKIGLSSEIGALLAGICLAGMPYANEIASRLRPLRDFFLVIFFITLGAGLTFHSFSRQLPIIIVATLIAVLAKPLVAMATMGFLGYTKRTSFKTAVSLAQVSEFSIVLVILGLHRGLIGRDVVSAITFIALISIAASSYLIDFSDRLFSMIEKHLNLFERKKTADVAITIPHNEVVLFGYQRGGHEFTELFKKLNQKYVVVDYDPDVVDLMARRKINYLYGDATDPEMLEEAGVERAKLVVSTIPDFDISMFLLSYLKAKNKRAISVFHADDPAEAAKLYEAGATYIVLPHYIGSEKLREFIGKSGLSKQAFRKERIKHLGYLEKNYEVLGKLNQLNERRLGHAIISSMAGLAKPKN